MRIVRRFSPSCAKDLWERSPVKTSYRSPPLPLRSRFVSVGPTEQRRPCWRSLRRTSRPSNAAWRRCWNARAKPFAPATCCCEHACVSRPGATPSPGSARAAASIIDRHQWLAAVTAFANPVLALGPMAVGAVQLRMLSEMAAVYDVQLSAEFVEKVGHQMAQTLLKLGVAEAVTSVLAGLIKFNPVGFAAGGVVQAVTMAYLTRLTGKTFVEYLEHGGNWGESGMQGELSRQLEETRRSEWLLQFAKMAIQRLFRR